MSKVLLAARTNAVLAPLTALASLTSTVAIARSFQPELYAEYAILMAVFAWGLIICELGCNVGITRFIHQASTLDAGFTLYQTLQKRRTFFVGMLTISFCLLAPQLKFGLPFDNSHLNWLLYGLIGLLTATTLHGQLSNSVLASLFEQKNIQKINQLFTLLRAIALTVSSLIIKEPILLVVVLTFVSIFESIMLNFRVRQIIANQNKPLHKTIINSSHLHGGVSLIDKMSTALTGVPLILIIFSGIYVKSDLALLAISSEVLQKALSVVGLPICGMVLPVLNMHADDVNSLKIKIDTIAGVSVLWFSFCMGLIYVFLPNGLSLLLGDGFVGVSNVSAIWVFPLFFEALVRMVWGASLLTIKEYKWLNIFNIISSLVILFLLFYSRNVEFRTLIIELGCLRILLAVFVLIKAWNKKILTLESMPINFVIFTLICTLLSLWVQEQFFDMATMIKLFIGTFVYLVSMLVFVKTLPLIPSDILQTLFKFLGRHHSLLRRIVFIAK